MPESWEVIVDGIIYQLQPKGGISRLFNEILPRMCGADDSLRITLLTQGQLRQPLPEHPRIMHCPIPNGERYLRPRCVWRSVIPTANRLVRKFWIGRGTGKIWHSTYYTMPEKWDGFLIVTVHDMIFERFADFYKGPNFDRFREDKRRCIQGADAVICVSETTRHEIQRFYGFDSDSIYVVPHAYGNAFRLLQQCGGGPGMSTKQPFLLYVGTRTHYKNFDMLLQAYSMWPQRKDIALVLVGSPWSDDEDNHLLKLGIRDRVQVLTNIDDQTLCQLYNQAVGFVYPSLYEGFGIPLLEAIACGCPVIASRIPSTIEVAGECPIYFDPAEVDDLLRAFDIALSEGRASKRVQIGLERVKSYSWNKAAVQTLEIYRAVRVN